MGANRDVPKLLRNKEEQREAFQNTSGAKGNKQKSFKHFRNKEEQRDSIPNF